MDDKRWMPASEPPKETQRVLVTAKRDNGLRFLTIAYWTEAGWSGLWNSNEVIAWMPLPQKYRGEIK